MKTKSFLNVYSHTLLAVAVFITMLAATDAFAAGGTLDPTFGTGGIVSTQFNNLPSSARDIALQADGKIVVLGDSQSTKVVARYNSNGSLDTGFGTNGVIPVEVPSFFGWKIALQVDGKIIVAGSRNGSFAVVRINANGTGLDNAFGSNGIASIPADVGDHWYSAGDLVIQPDGRIVVVGTESNQGNFTNFVVARFNSDGSQDFMRLFDKADFPNNRYNGANAVAVQPDNKIVVSGGMMDDDGKGQLTLARLTPDGLLDKSAFGTNGKGTVMVAIPSFHSHKSFVAIQSDGRIVVAGTANDADAALVRFNGNGTPDPSFGGTGIVITDLGANELVNDMVIQADGKIIVAGRTSNLDAGDFLLLRYNSDGSLDTSFGANGKVVTDFGNSAESASGIALQVDGKVLVGGSSGNNAILARYDTGSSGATNTATFKSSAAYDGWVLESGKKTNRGGSVDRTSSTINVGDDAKDRQYRGILSFDTSSIPDDAVVTSVQVRIKRQGVVGADPFNTHGSLLLEIRNGTFSNNLELRVDDFSAAANVGSNKDAFSGAVDNWHTASLSSVNLGSINKSGPTQFRLLFSRDDNDDMGADYVKFFSGNAGSDQPQLIVTYSTSGGAGNRAPIINGGATLSFSIPENTTTVAAVSATDPDGQPVTYSISGADAGKFSINPGTGILTFVAPPDFETIPSGTIYRVTAQASDGSLTATQDISVTVTPVNEFAPVVTSGTNISLPENTVGVTTITVTDADLPTPTIQYVFAGGADDHLFTIDQANGKLSFVTAPSYNAPNDAGLDHVYNVKFEIQDEDHATPLELVISIPSPNIPTGEMLDPTFGTNGVVTINFENLPSSVRGIGLQLDNKIVILGSARVSADSSDYAYRKFLTRYVSNGVLDTSFGTNGIAPIDIGNFSASTIEVLSDGKILVGGNYPGVARYNSNGILDTSFGTNGVGMLDLHGHNVNIRDMAVQPDGKILLIGDQTTGDANYTEFFVARFTGGGQVDSTFVANGFLIIGDFPNYRYNYGQAVVIQADGNIVVSGNMMDNDGKASLALARLNQDGTLDKTGFGTNGRGTVSTLIPPDFQTSSGALALQADGKIVVVGTANNNLILARYNTNGALDTTFGGTGIVTTDFGDTEMANDLVIQSDGKILVVGNAPTGEYMGFLLVRYNPDGSLDTSFGANGKTVTSFGNSSANATMIVQQPDGKVLVSGFSGINGVNWDNAHLARYNVGTPAATNTLSFESVAAHDGWILESGENTNLGGTLEKVSNALFVGDDARDRQYRSILSFPTNSLPDDAILTSARLKIRKQGIVGTDPFDTHGDLLLEIRNGTFSNTAALNVEDFSASANSGSTQDKFVETDGDWCVAALSNINLGLVNKYGFTQFRLRFSKDDNDDLGTDYDRFFSGNASGDQPELVVTYTTPNSRSLVVMENFAVTSGQALTSASNAPVFTSPTTFSVAENMTTTGILTATDADVPAQMPAYSIIGGADAALFAINSSTSELAFLAAPDFEQPKDSGADNVYNLTIQASDGTLAATQDISVTVTGITDNAPLISSSGTISIAENTTTVVTLTATDADLPTQALTYSLNGGADSAFFAVNPSTGELTFLAAPDFEQPKDSGADNIYSLTVQATDGALTTTQDISVSVTGVTDNAPLISSSGTISIAENTSAVTMLTASDADLPAQTLTYSIVGGVDSARFTINSIAGELAFAAAPDYEVPTDVGSDNIYNVTVQASDGELVGSQDIVVTVTVVNDNTPTITSTGSLSISENSMVVTTVTATDADLPVQTLTYSIAGGVDSTLFAVNSSTGELTFVAAPDYEVQKDAGLDNVYNVTVQASDGQLSATQDITVTVMPVNDNPPVITSPAGFSISENATAVGVVSATDADLPSQTLTYSVVGGADSTLFKLNTSTGVLDFVTARDYESPNDAGGDNVYNLTVQASDGTLTVTKDLAVTILPVNDNTPVVTSSDKLFVFENTTAAVPLAATDADRPAQPLTYSIIGGADMGRFSIVNATGELKFVTTPDFEAPADSNLDNIYEIVVQVSDGTYNATKNISLQVKDRDG